ncbi:uncharacterized protein MCYG_04737 [Microsporum canis CBS 113480]|uniref:Uncharacterized protein n=1 Tax=Arthroderma otae (strain ATCC MYA-4605 / CBS 113480) TaxID=554155 RepID=C5FPW5_ARTOC|nr:uncharacterized protein MCYG_04737 [Microsporum canis CBS 113480]EEQ31918.1 predicted protein [Microsporum canis CBS 113480]
MEKKAGNSYTTKAYHGNECSRHKAKAKYFKWPGQYGVSFLEPREMACNLRYISLQYFLTVYFNRYFTLEIYVVFAANKGVTRCSHLNTLLGDIQLKATRLLPSTTLSALTLYSSNVLKRLRFFLVEVELE